MVNIQIQNDPAFDLLSVSGEIDASSSIELDNAIISAVATPTTKLIVDLSGLDYISSAGLGVFISHLEDLRQKDKQLILSGLKENVFEVFRILGLEQIITIVPTKDEAIKI